MTEWPIAFGPVVRQHNMHGRITWWRKLLTSWPGSKTKRGRDQGPTVSFKDIPPVT
jgi:hypothetical protein